jgi:hypothetical protein
MGEYFRQTRTRTYSYLAAVPLLLAYEVLIVMGNRGSNDPVHVGAYVYTMRSFYAMLHGLGVSGNLWVGGILLGIGMILHFSERKQGVEVAPGYFPVMLLECCLLAFGSAWLLGMAVQTLIPNLWAQTLALNAQTPFAGTPVALRLALALGAGLYEELVFRVLIFGLLALAFKNAWHQRPVLATCLAALVASVIFSGVHYLPPLGDPLEAGSFLYRFLFGLVLTGLYAWRGFGIAAWTHALYDVMVLTWLQA